MVVAGSGANFYNTVADLQEGDVEGTAAKVEDQNGLFLVGLFEAVGEGSCGGLVHNAEHVEASDLASVLSGLALCVIEVGRNGDDGIGDGFTQVGFCIALQFHEHVSRDFLRSVLLSVNIIGLPVGANVALHRANSAVNVSNCLVLSRLPDENFTILGESNDGRGGAGSLRVGDNLRFSAF